MKYTTAFLLLFVFAIGWCTGSAWHYLRLPPFGLGLFADVRAMFDARPARLGLETTAQLQKDERTTQGFTIVYPSVHQFLTAKLAQQKLQETQTPVAPVSEPTAIEGKGTPDLRLQLSATLGVPQECLESKALLVQRTPVAERDGALLEQVIFETFNSELRLFGLLGTPKVSGKLPVVIAIHGVGGSPERIFGLDSPPQYESPEYHHEFGLRLIREGFAVFTPQLITEIEQQGDHYYNKSRSTLDLRAMPFGYRIHGIEIGMISSVIGYFLQENAAHTASIAAYGISLGGQTAFYLAALDQRIQAVVVSQWMDDRATKLAGLRHPLPTWRFVRELSNAFPGILRNMDDANVAKLIAPRPLFVETGEQDERAEGATLLMPKLREIYAANDAPRFSICFEKKPGAGHEIVLNGSLEFLRYWLFAIPQPQLSRFCDA